MLYSFVAFFALFWVSLCARDPLVVWKIAVAPRQHQDTQGWRLSLALPFRIPSQISFDELNSAVMSTEFSIFLHTFRNGLAI